MKKSFRSTLAVAGSVLLAASVSFSALALVDRGAANDYGPSYRSDEAQSDKYYQTYRRSGDSFPDTHRSQERIVPTDERSMDRTGTYDVSGNGSKGYANVNRTNTPIYDATGNGKVVVDTLDKNYRVEILSQSWRYAHISYDVNGTPYVGYVRLNNLKR